MAGQPTASEATGTATSKGDVVEGKPAATAGQLAAVGCQPVGPTTARMMLDLVMGRGATASSGGLVVKMKEEEAVIERVKPEAVVVAASSPVAEPSPTAAATEGGRTRSGRCSTRSRLGTTGSEHDSS
ncbi:hypothetical protein GUJ93_ZPchr0001g29790 [Zizania palustris]|uniref:Uncharacterized protein n=1 Tax=Zizania palustris TaxID=103762 RepID=A0A8J5S088_ZIZPA|nr:hypothetical protein GUJ93_ZPchr0001g29790 [Zizania palustris]